MELFYVIIIIWIVLYLFYKKRKQPAPSLYTSEDDFLYHYQKRDFLLNIPERRFFEYISSIIPDCYAVYPQIPLRNIVKVKNPNGNFRSYQGRINQNSIDFVIFTKPYLTPVLAIEYDGKTHQKPERRKRDTKVNAILGSCNIDCIHIQHKKDLNYAVIKRTVLTALEKYKLT